MHRRRCIIRVTSICHWLAACKAAKTPWRGGGTRTRLLGVVARGGIAATLRTSVDIAAAHKTKPSGQQRDLIGRVVRGGEDDTQGASRTIEMPA